MTLQTERGSSTMTEILIFSHPDQPNLVNKYFLYDQFGYKIACWAGKLAHIHDFHQWFCKGKACRAIQVI